MSGMESRRHLYHVYILECADGSYYTGVTNNLVRRLKEHQSGTDGESYTAQRLPVQLVYSERHLYIMNAIAREKSIKSWSRAKKKASIEGSFQNLRMLSKKKFKK